MGEGAARVGEGAARGSAQQRRAVGRALGVRGGVEFGFMSTTPRQGIAEEYAAMGAAGHKLVFEVQMGMVDRGAELDWLSQYPAEKEICFAPLTGIDVCSYRIVGEVLVASVRPSVNLNAKTIEEVMAKMKS